MKSKLEHQHLENHESTTLLGNLVENFDSKRIPISKMKRKKGMFPYYGASGIIDFVDDYILDGEYLLISEDGENLRSRQSPIAFLTNGKFWANNHVHIVKANEKSNNRFLFYVLNFLNMDGFLTGTAQPKLNQENMNLITIPNFSILEQTHIGKILYNLDSKIQNLKNQNKILEQIIQSIFKSWFVDFDGQTEFVDSELGKIPKGWKVVPFKEMASCVKGFSYKGIEKFDEPQGFEFVTLNSIKEGGGFKKKFTWLESNRLKERHYVKEMDLIIANTEQTKDARLLATPAIVQFSYNYDKQLAVYSHHISKIEPKIQNVKFYLYSFFLYYQQIIANAYHTGTGVWGFDHTSFEINHLTLQPTHEILKKLEKNAFVIHAKNIENEKSISLLIFIRDSLLPKLMSGEIRV